jgi:hypothetical protein
MTDTRDTGGFIWYELMTSDAEGAKDFYEAVVGWSIGEPVPNANGYRMIGRSDGGFAGGILPISDDMASNGARPGWLGYVHVADVDATVRDIEQAGGSIWMPPTDIGTAGRVALVTDPQAAPFYVMTPKPPEGNPDAQSDVFSPNAVQRCAWNELATSDLDAAKRFYTERFGWVLGDAMPMGPMGDYQFIHANGERIGAMFAPGDLRPAWRFCFRVESLERSIDAIRSGGGKILFGPTDVPGGGRIVQANDSEGVFFMVIEGGQQ